MSNPPAKTLDLEPLRRLVRRLRAPDGCPWDREQTPRDVRGYLIEEAHEAAAALDRAVAEDDWSPLGEELGDLLFQIVFVAVLGEERDRLGLPEVLSGVERKMIDRHPHVFGDAERLADAETVRRQWERRKRAVEGRRSALDGVPDTLPALTAAHRIGQKAAGIGFDWQRADEVLEKVEEEIAELREVMAEADRQRVEDEIGDLLFAVASLARHLEVDPEAALARANLKFRRRFSWVESRDPGADHPERRDRLERLWQEAKARERAPTD